MATRDITEPEFMPLIEGDGVVVVDFWAEWCGPCKSFGPIYEEVSENHPDAVFAKVDTEAEQALSGGLGIRSIPTLMVFRDGIQLFNQAGAMPAAALEDIVGQVKALDMDEIRERVEAAKAEESAKDNAEESAKDTDEEAAKDNDTEADSVEPS